MILYIHCNHIFWALTHQYNAAPDTISINKDIFSAQIWYDFISQVHQEVGARKNLVTARTLLKYMITTLRFILDTNLVKSYLCMTLSYFLNHFKIMHRAWHGSDTTMLCAQFKNDSANVKYIIRTSCDIRDLAESSYIVTVSRCFRWTNLSSYIIQISVESEMNTPS